MNASDPKVSRKQALQYLMAELQVIKQWLAINPAETLVGKQRMMTMLAYDLPSTDKTVADTLFRDSVLLSKYLKAMPSKSMLTASN